MKVLCVLFPHFPLNCEVQGNPALKDHPVIIVDAAGSQKTVLDYSPELDGVQYGMPLQQALSLYGQVELIQADLPRYWSVFNELLDALEEKSPLVEGSELGCAYLGLDGMQSIYPSDDILVTGVREAIPAVFTPQMGIAGGKFLAYLAARYASPGGYRTLDGDVGVFLRDLPCDVLPVSVKSKEKLHDFGMRTLGQVASLPVGPIQAQFGPEGRIMYRLVRGLDDTPLFPRCWEENIEESIALLSVATSLEVILLAVTSLISRVFARNSLRGRGIISLNLWTRTLGSGHWERHIRFREPVTDVKSAVSRIRLFLENFPQPGPVEELGLKITGLGYRSGRQRSLFAEVRAKEHLMNDIKQLEIRLGNPEVFQIKEVEPWSRIPERRYALAPLSR